jgi:DinB superfamily
MRNTLVFVLSFMGVAISTAAQSTQAPRMPVGEVIDLWVSRTEQLVVPAADALPERAYGFRPTAGEFNGVRTFAEQVTHLAAANYQLAALVLGEDPPPGTKNETAPPSVRTKAEIMSYLRASFASLHRAARKITVQNVEDAIVVGNESQNAAGVVIDALVHDQNHYGQMIEYLRMNGIVPPASR